MNGALVPLPLGDEAADAEGISPASATLVHESLKLLVKDSDLENARIKRWRKTGQPVAGAVQAAAFSNGDAFLATRNYGYGRSIIATSAFDARSGNLPARRSFVPLVHELITWAAGGGVELNVDSAWSPNYALDSNAGGLTAKNFPQPRPQRSAAARAHRSAPTALRRRHAGRPARQRLRPGNLEVVSGGGVHPVSIRKLPRPLGFPLPPERRRRASRVRRSHAVAGRKMIIEEATQRTSGG